MDKFELIQKTTQDILDTCPNWDKKIFIVKPFSYGDTDIAVMYDTFAFEWKKVYYDSIKGLYIKGRASSNEGIRYFSGCNGFEFTNEYIELEKERIENLNKIKSTIIKKKDLKIGGIYRRFEKDKSIRYCNYYLYITENTFFKVGQVKTEDILGESNFINSIHSVIDKVEVNWYCIWDIKQMKVDKFICEISKEALGILQKKLKEDMLSKNY